MAAKVDYLKDHPNITLVHENEKDIYGEKGAGCVDLMTTINSPKLRSAFDFANFVQCGEHPLDNWPSLKPFTTHIHIKDALLDGGSVLLALSSDSNLLAFKPSDKEYTELAKIKVADSPTWACPIISGEASSPVTSAPHSAICAVSCPGPQPRSRMRSPRRGSSSSRSASPNCQTNE